MYRELHWNGRNERCGYDLRLYLIIPIRLGCPLRAWKNRNGKKLPLHVMFPFGGSGNDRPKGLTFPVMLPLEGLPCRRRDVLPSREGLTQPRLASFSGAGVKHFTAMQAALNRQLPFAWSHKRVAAMPPFSLDADITGWQGQSYSPAKAPGIRVLHRYSPHATSVASPRAIVVTFTEANIYRRSFQVTDARDLVLRSVNVIFFIFPLELYLATGQN